MVIDRKRNHLGIRGENHHRIRVGILLRGAGQPIGDATVHMVDGPVNLDQLGQVPIRRFPLPHQEVLRRQVHRHGPVHGLFYRTERQVEPHHRAQLVHHRAVTRHHIDPDDRTEALLHGRHLFENPLVRLDADVCALIGDGVFKRLHQRREVHRHRTILVLVAERAVFALFVFQLRPGGFGQVFLVDQLQCLGVQPDFKLLLRVVRELEGVEKTEGVGFSAVGHTSPRVRQGRRQENRGANNDTIIAAPAKGKSTPRTTFPLRRPDPFSSSGLPHRPT